MLEPPQRGGSTCNEYPQSMFGAKIRKGSGYFVGPSKIGPRSWSILEYIGVYWTYRLFCRAKYLFYILLSILIYILVLIYLVFIYLRYFSINRLLFVPFYALNFGKVEWECYDLSVSVQVLG